MITINNNAQNFRAKFINNIKVGKLTQKRGKYADEVASFVKIDTNNPSDIQALENIALYWEKEKFAANIFYAARSAFDKEFPAYDDVIYAITTQRNCLDKLEDNKILGLVDILPENNNLSAFIEYIQVKPSMVYSAKPEFKGIGTGMLTSLKQMYDKISCIPLCEKSVKNFYKKNGFIPHNEDKHCVVWYKA